ncbi:MAG: dihydropteroate synthase [Candidatus Aminicenantales bacterium]
MGILNVTPDSFSDGGRYFETGTAVERGLEMIREGADIVDVGGESTRPGSRPVPADEESRRVIPVIRGLRDRTEALISVDTAKASVARQALDAGADIVNDTTALRGDPEMAAVTAGSGAALVLMHMKGVPETMQVQPSYGDLFGEVGSFLEDRIEASLRAGISPECLIIDPGIGFGKRLEDNLALINGLGFLEPLDRPILAGISRKAFIGKVLGGLPSEDRLEGTLAAAVLSVARGAHIVRVHDVRAVRRAVDTADAILAGPAESARPDLEGMPHAG